MSLLLYNMLWDGGSARSKWLRDQSSPLCLSPPLGGRHLALTNGLNVFPWEHFFWGGGLATVIYSLEWCPRTVFCCVGWRWGGVIQWRCSFKCSRVCTSLFFECVPLSCECKVGIFHLGPLTVQFWKLCLFVFFTSVGKFKNATDDVNVAALFHLWLHPSSKKTLS